MIDFKETKNPLPKAPTKVI